MGKYEESVGRLQSPNVDQAAMERVQREIRTLASVS